MRTTRSHYLVALLVSISGCTVPSDSVMTWNLYIGADVTRPLGATTMPQLAAAVAQSFAIFQANDFRVRAEAIADHIADEMPALIGLQEISTVRLQSPGDRINGGFTPARDVVIDFERVLMKAIADRGLPYKVAARIQNVDVELPMARPDDCFDDLRITDHDIILRRTDIPVHSPFNGNYAASVVVPLPDGLSTIDIKRGFVGVRARIDGTWVQFVNTHLEVAGPFAPIQVAQTAELIQRLATRPGPVMLVGDFNSAADGSTTPSYALIDNAGYTDAWLLGGSGPGFTCCQAEDLRNPTSILSERIDVIWLRDHGLLHHLDVEAHLIGEELGDRINGMWPSDHAGVVATFEPSF